MNFTHRNKRTSFLIRDILRVNRETATAGLIVNHETSTAACLTESTEETPSLTGSLSFRTLQTASSSSSSSHHRLLGRRDDGLVMMISAAPPSGDCFTLPAAGGGFNGYPTSLSAVEAYLVSAKIPSSSSSSRYLFPASLLPPSSTASSFDHNLLPLHAHSSDPCVHQRFNPSSSTSSSATSLILPTAVSVASPAVTATTVGVGIANWSSPFSSMASGFFSSDLDHHHHHLLLHRNHLDARNQQLNAAHVCRLDSPPASSFELMTVADDDNDADDAVEGSEDRDTQSEVGRDSISGSVSPGVVIASGGKNNSGGGSFNATGRSLHHEQQWLHHHLDGHFHAYPGKEHRGGHEAGGASDQDTHDECNNVRKIRRNRTVFTELQLMGLERRFDSQKYLSTPDRADLARVLGLTQLQVKTWYQVWSTFSLSHFKNFF